MLDNKVIAYQCQDKRKNSPSVGMVTMKTDNIEDKQTWQHDLHIDSTLQLNNSRSAEALRME